MPAGRPNKKTDLKIKIILTALVDGLGRVTACKRADISYPTFLQYLEDDAEFLKQVLEAEKAGKALRKEMLENCIYKAANKKDDWRAAAWMLEHRKETRDEYTPKQEHEIEGDITINVNLGDEK